jgi:hypothetical protein
MASKFEFRASAFSAALDALAQGIKEAGEVGMQKVVDAAAEDARRIKSWRDPGEYEEDYDSGHWQWTVTGTAAASIVGYVVPKKTTLRGAAEMTTSYWNGIPLKHPHPLDDSVTQDTAPQDDTIIGVVTMNVAYAPYLQAWETDHGFMGGQQEYPVTVEVFEMMWGNHYAPNILRPEIEKRMAAIARRFTS